MTMVDWDAELDPWVQVDLIDGTRVLYGYALSHVETGGLAWTRSSPVRRYDIRASLVVTASGRRYRLGRRIGFLDLPDLEARVAFALLIGPDLKVSFSDLVGPRIREGEAADWLRACKMARHIGKRPPPLDGAAITDFLRQHQATYRQVRGWADPS
jgi:hypothetical protein